MKNVHNYQLKSLAVSSIGKVTINRPHLLWYKKDIGQDYLTRISALDDSVLIAAGIGKMKEIELALNVWGLCFEAEQYLSIADFREPATYNFSTGGSPAVPESTSTAIFTTLDDVAGSPSASYHTHRSYIPIGEVIVPGVVYNVHCFGEIIASYEAQSGDDAMSVVAALSSLLNSFDGDHWAAIPGNTDDSFPSFDIGSDSDHVWLESIVKNAYSLFESVEQITIPAQDEVPGAVEVESILVLISHERKVENKLINA